LEGLRRSASIALRFSVRGGLVAGRPVPTRRSADLRGRSFGTVLTRKEIVVLSDDPRQLQQQLQDMAGPGAIIRVDGFEGSPLPRSEEHTSELQSRSDLVCRLLLEKKNNHEDKRKAI